MLSLSKVFWLAIILLCIWYLFKIIEKRKVNSRNSKANSENNSRKGIDAYKCEKCVYGVLEINVIIKNVFKTIVLYTIYIQNL